MRAIRGTFFFFQAEDGIRDIGVTGVQTCALPISGKLFTAKDMVEDPHYEARENVVTVEDPEIGPFPMQNVVPRLTDTPARVRWAGPALGQHNDEVYGELLKLSEEEQTGRRERGVV